MISMIVRTKIAALRISPNIQALQVISLAVMSMIKGHMALGAIILDHWFLQFGLGAKSCCEETCSNHNGNDKARQYHPEEDHDCMVCRHFAFK